MWLLNTHTARLRKFLSPEAVPPNGYAILSHCWDNKEQDFQEIEGLRNHDDPREAASSKIKNFCILAERLGYEWGWADTCCIDKTSSSDLSEAINSMFRYYSLSAVCIVFLHDVPANCDIRKDDSEFRKSRWHKRGWTLQELIAPKKVVFYSQDWLKELTTKDGDAPLLEEITGIPKEVLMGKKEIWHMSVAARISWAAHRQTTREEDEAYCLLGILKVDSMHPSYGDGRHAFYRLQEELLKHSTDTTFFAWGQAIDMVHLRKLQNIRLPQPLAIRHDHKVEPYLFAPSPSCFENGSKIRWMPNISLGSSGCTFDISAFLRYNVTQYGVLARVPVAELKAQRLVVALLACSQDGDRLGLVLKECNNTDATSPEGPIYDVSFPNSDGIFRLARLTREDGDSQGLPSFEWRDIYIRMRPSAGEAIAPSQELKKDPMEQEDGWIRRLVHMMAVILGLQSSQ